MGNDFEDYLRANRERLEKGGPSPKVWQNIEAGLLSRQQKNNRVVRMRLVGWSVAAGLILGIGLAYLILRNNGMKPVITNNQPAIKKTIPVAVPVKSPETVYAQKQAPTAAKTSLQRAYPAKTSGRESQQPDQAIDYYAHLVLQRQQQFKQLQSLDPGLYNESQKAIAELNVTYNQLQRQLSNSVNRQKVMEMMVQNLQMQEKILSNQLELIHEAEAKNGADDKTL